MPLTVQRENFPRLEPEWRELAPACSLPSVFLSPAFLRVWWDEFGGDRELLLLSVRDDGRLRGVVPLMRDGDGLSFAGDTKVCDYMDFSCTAGLETDAVSAALRSLGEEPWGELHLWAMRDDSPALAALPVICRDLGLKLEIEEEDVCPQIALPASFEEYLAGLGKKDRHELRRKLRRLQQAGDVALEVLDTPDALTAAMDEFLRLHTISRAAKATFMTPKMERFFRTLVPRLGAEGLVEMAFLTIGGKRTAVVLCFRDGDEVLLYNSGYDPDYAGFSVGLLSKAMALERAIEQGKTKFDFLRGAEPYKYDLGATDLKVHRATIRRA